LAAWVKRTREQFTKEGVPPRIVLISPIAYEATGKPGMPDGKEENANLKLYTDAMAEFASAEKIPFVDLFSKTPQKPPRDSQGKRIVFNHTINGVHLNPIGDMVVAKVLDSELFGS